MKLGPTNQLDFVLNLADINATEMDGKNCLYCLYLAKRLGQF